MKACEEYRVVRPYLTYDVKYYVGKVGRLVRELGRSALTGERHLLLEFPTLEGPLRWAAFPESCLTDVCEEGSPPRLAG